MNPEFVRNTWLELSPLKLWGLFGVLVALMVVVNAVGTPPPDQALNWTATRYLGLNVFTLFALWGAHKAAHSVSQEVVGATWDWQRLAEHRPWELLVGKLFGSTVFEWVGAASGLMLFALGSGPVTSPGATLLNVVSLAFSALFLQSLALLASLATATSLRATRRPGSNRARQGGMTIVILILLFSVGPALHQSLAGHEHGARVVTWWWTMPMSVFVPLSLVMFIFWTLLGAHRLIRAELQEPVSPLPWIGCMAFLAAYLYPIVPRGELPGLLSPTGLFFLLTAALCGAFYYPLLLGERKDVVRVRSLAAAWRRGDEAGVWTRLPLWTFNLVGYVLSVAGLAVSAVFRPNGAVWAMVAFGVSMGLFMLRDLGWILAVHLAPTPGRRPDLAVWFFLAVLYLLVPLVLGTLGDIGGMALPLLLPGPWELTSGTAAIGALVTHAIWALPGLAVAWTLAAPRLALALKPEASKAPSHQSR